MKMTLTAEEIKNGKLEPEKLAIAIEQVKANGYIVFDKSIRRRTDRRAARGLRPDVRRIHRTPRLQYRHNRAQMHLPFQAPFNDPSIIEHPIAMAVIDGLLGEYNKISYFASDTPMPGSDYQAVHCDINPLFPDMSVALPPFSLVLNIPLVDTTDENGPLEVWPGGTHLHGDRANQDTLGGIVNPHMHIVRAAEYMHSEKVYMSAGSIVIRDIRMWHRGTPNRSDYRRTNIALIDNRDWFGSGYSIQIPRETYGSLPKRSQQLLRSEKSAIR